MSMVEKVLQAGVVGCGGAGFPTHIKLAGNVHDLIINGVECEPLLNTDRWLMCNRAGDMVATIMEICEYLHAEKCTIALKQSYEKEIASLEAAIKECEASIELHKVESIYPSGDEQQVVYEVTGHVVPAAGIPLDVHAVVLNVATVLAIFDALSGKPFIRKYLTVTGEVAHPVVINVPVGTSFSHCIRLAGGSLREKYVVVSGGPMMGQVMTMSQAGDASVTKTTSGIIVLEEDSYLSRKSAIDLKHTINRARSVCIQCTLCTQLCPRYLLGHPLEPHRIMRQLAMSGEITAILDDPHVRQALLCCECGICEIIACPMELQPCKVNKIIKDELSKAGIKYPKQPKEYLPHPFREERKVGTEKAAARVGVLEYYHYGLREIVEDTPSIVSIPLRMHIGVPSKPIVSKGEIVHEGQIIAECPAGRVGANIHASIGGQVLSVDRQIVIEAGDMYDI